MQVQAVDVLVRGETSVTLTEYIIVFGAANLLLCQCPHFHALRYINTMATFCTISFSIIAVCLSIYSGARSKYLFPAPTLTALLPLSAMCSISSSLLVQKWRTQKLRFSACWLKRILIKVPECLVCKAGQIM